MKTLWQLAQDWRSRAEFEKSNNAYVAKFCGATGANTVVRTQGIRGRILEECAADLESWACEVQRETIENLHGLVLEQSEFIEILGVPVEKQ